MTQFKKKTQFIIYFIAAILLLNFNTRADIVTDWNIKVCNIVVEAKLSAANAIRIMAIVHTALYEAVNSITKRYPSDVLQLESTSGASIDAAIASAIHTTLLKLLPSQQPAIDSTYSAALDLIADSEAKVAGILVGENSAMNILKLRLDDGAGMNETYRPYTKAGVYVPTVIPAVPQWPKRKPWLMSSPSQFRPGPPPELTSALWSRDYNEIKSIGKKNSTLRTSEQTEIARFWETTQPSIYHGIVRSIALIRGREVTQNARLFAMVTEAADDALIAVMDAKYCYNFWRPITAIRNGDIDGNDGTERDSTWMPFIDTPLHPEYPCAHCIVSGAIGTVLQAEIGIGPMPTLTTTSSTANGIERSWTKIEDFEQEVANARIYDGVHYRNSTEVGTSMGKKIGELAVEKFLGVKSEAKK